MRRKQSPLRVSGGTGRGPVGFNQSSMTDGDARRARGHGRSKSARQLAWVLVSFMVTLLAGCEHGNPKFTKPGPVYQETTPMTSVTLTNQLEPEWLKPPTSLFTLGPGDKLEIETLGETNSLTTTTIGPDGKIYYSILPGLDVWGMTLTQAKQTLERELSKFVREPPQISLILRGVESQRIWILGYVAVPGVYPLAGPTTLLEAIAMAGGTMSLSAFRQQEVSGASDEVADLRRSFVLRHGKLLPVDFERLLQRGDLSQNIYLEPDDFVYFPAATAKEVYVLGAVAQARAVPYREGLTVASAVASAYGTVTGAYMSHVAVVRGSLSRPEIAIVDYRRVIRGEAMDVALQPRDIVYVPFAPYRYLTRYAQLIVDTFVSSAAINAGTSQIGQPAGGAAGVFIPVGAGVRILPPVTPPPIR